MGKGLNCNSSFPWHCSLLLFSPVKKSSKTVWVIIIIGTSKEELSLSLPRLPTSIPFTRWSADYLELKLKPYQRNISERKSSAVSLHHNCDYVQYSCTKIFAHIKIYLKLDLCLRYSSAFLNVVLFTSLHAYLFFIKLLDGWMAGMQPLLLFLFIHCALALDAC